MQPPDPSANAQLARHPAVDALRDRVGARLADAATALASVTHKSFVNEHRGEGLQDNERLEFLGDAVIDLAVSHRLMERFPDAREGELSKLRAALVDEPALARMARAIDLGALLRLGRGEELTGGREKASLLADAMEAVIAAVYLDGGLEAVLSLVDRFLGDAFDRAAAGTLDRDHKTQLQEVAQSRLRASPRYRVVAERGPDHSKIFEVEIELRGEPYGRGSGRSKKDAEQAAAKAALERLAEHLPEPAPTPPPAVVLEAAPPAPPEPAVPAAPVALPEPSPPAAAATPAPPAAPEAPAGPPRKAKPRAKAGARAAAKRPAASARPRTARGSARPAASRPRSGKRRG